MMFAFYNFGVMPVHMGFELLWSNISINYLCIIDSRRCAIHTILIFLIITPCFFLMLCESLSQFLK